MDPKIAKTILNADAQSRPINLAGIRRSHLTHIM